jgi:hypothetical protein
MCTMSLLHEPTTVGTVEPASESQSARFWPFVLYVMVIGAIVILPALATFFIGVPRCGYANPSFEECTLEHLAR